MLTASTSGAHDSLPSRPPTGGSNKGAKKPFKIRDELLAPSRLAPKVQQLYDTRRLSIEEISHQVLLLVLACAKCCAVAGKKSPRVGVLGGGHVGCTVVMTLLGTGYRADSIALSTRQPDRIPRCEVLKAPSALPMFQQVPRYYDNARLARESDILVLCMPPSQLKSVVIQVRHAIAASIDAPPLVLSALCGVTLQSLTKACGSQAVVRVQPDVAKITSHWQLQQQEQQEQAEALHGPSGALPPASSAFQQETAADRRQVSSLRLAAEALVPHRDSVEQLLTALTPFAKRVWTDDQDPRLQEVLLAQPHSMTVPSWPVEWEQDLAKLHAAIGAATG